MLRFYPVLISCLVAASPMAALAGVINFDDLPNGTVVSNQYAGVGATFGSGNFSVIGGLSEGDPGNWGLEGTNGPHFLGFNGSPSYAQAINWLSDINGFSLDVSRSAGSQAGDTFTLTGLLNGLIVDTETLSLASINTWTTVALTGTFDEIQWNGTGSSFHPFGVDNLVFNAAQVPEPGSLALLGLGFVGVLVSIRRFKA